MKIAKSLITGFDAVTKGVSQDNEQDKQRLITNLKNQPFVSTEVVIGLVENSIQSITELQERETVLALFAIAYEYRQKYGEDENYIHIMETAYERSKLFTGDIVPRTMENIAIIRVKEHANELIA